MIRVKFEFYTSYSVEFHTSYSLEFHTSYSVEFYTITMSLLMFQHRIEHDRESRAHSVRLYRSYRHGDYPDVEISNAELIAPLQTLALVGIVSNYSC